MRHGLRFKSHAFPQINLLFQVFFAILLIFRMEKRLRITHQCRRRKGKRILQSRKGGLSVGGIIITSVPLHEIIRKKTPFTLCLWLKEMEIQKILELPKWSWGKFDLQMGHWTAKQKGHSEHVEQADKRCRKYRTDYELAWWKVRVKNH